MIIPVILSGGAGSRLWPLSRKALPKQLLPLVTDSTLLQETISRVRGEGFAAPLVIAGQDHRFIVAEQLRSAGISDAKIMLEPVGRNTAPAAALAALEVFAADPDGLVLLMPSDHIILDQESFRNAIFVAAKAAAAGSLVTFGIKPSAPATGYGYIKSAAALAEAPGAWRIERFVEKPDLATAEQYLASGEYFWNSGLFLFAARTFLAEMERLEPVMLAHCRQSLAEGERDEDFIRLGETAFRGCPAQSIDYAIMEHATHAAVVPVDMGWNDIGSWQALWEIAERNADGNVVRGDVVMVNCRNSYVRSEGALVAAVGIENLIVVATPDAVLISHLDTTQDVKKIVEHLQSSQRLDKL